MSRELPINSRVIKHLANATVKSIYDGIVELITNSDDSYRRLEAKGLSVSGEIKIIVKRKKGGHCEQLIVQDYAEGMSKEELLKAIEFGGSTSGFEEGKSVRGFFGRGLKETIVALGEGDIVSVKDGIKSCTKIWTHEETGNPVYDDERLNHFEKTQERNGTKVEITIQNEKIKVPRYEIFKQILTTHYALRDILSSNKRKVILRFVNAKDNLDIESYEAVLRFPQPEGKLVVDKEVILENYGDKVRVVVYESTEPLSSPKNNPSGLAGILIKTNSAILDNQLFKFENEPAALYFFGSAFCQDIEKRIRDGDTGIIDPNRGGIEWKHDYSRALSKAIESILEPLISQKKAELENEPQKEMSESKKKFLARVCHKLNEMALQEELDDEDDIGTLELEAKSVDKLLLKPEVANIETGKVRSFSVYAPKELVDIYGSEVVIRSDSEYINFDTKSVKLELHEKYPDTYYGRFRILVTIPKIEAKIIAQLGSEIAISRIMTQTPQNRKRGEIVSKRRGIISQIIPDETPDPPQRVSYKDGIIRIFVKFPAVANFIGPGLDGIESAEGKLLLAEIIGEAFVKEMARRRIESGKYPIIPGSEIDSYNNIINELQKKFLHQIQEVIFSSKKI